MVAGVGENEIGRPIQNEAGELVAEIELRGSRRSVIARKFRLVIRVRAACDGTDDLRAAVDLSDSMRSGIGHIEIARGAIDRHVRRAQGSARRDETVSDSVGRISAARIRRDDVRRRVDAADRAVAAVGDEDVACAVDDGLGRTIEQCCFRIRTCLLYTSDAADE